MDNNLSIVILTISSFCVFMSMLFMCYILINGRTCHYWHFISLEGIKKRILPSRPILPPFQMRKIGEFLYTRNLDGPSYHHDDIMFCYICMLHEPTAILLECGHAGICSTCAQKIWVTNRRCPLCQKTSESVIVITQGDEKGLVTVKNV